jgi:hypothetical protein
MLFSASELEELTDPVDRKYPYLVTHFSVVSAAFPVLFIEQLFY